MAVSSKCYYALRAIYALAEHASVEPLKIADIADRELIPIRFLEVILGQLKGGGFVRSRRGAEGGYFLARRPDEITVGEVVRAMDGPLSAPPPPGRGGAFETLLRELHAATLAALEERTLADILSRTPEGAGTLSFEI